jgi:hypothetical protein
VSPWSLQRQRTSIPGQTLHLPELGEGRKNPSLAAEPVPVERTHSTAPVVKISRKNCNNKALGESTFKSLVNYCHRRGSQIPLPVNVKQALPSQYAAPFEALPPSSITVGPTEA